MCFTEEKIFTELLKTFQYNVVVGENKILKTFLKLTNRKSFVCHIGGESGIQCCYFERHVATACYWIARFAYSTVLGSKENIQYYLKKLLSAAICLTMRTRWSVRSSE